MGDLINMICEDSEVSCVLCILLYMNYLDIGCPFLGCWMIHSNSPYPGTARNSETPGSWNNPTVPQNKYDLVYTDIYIYTF